MGVGGRERRWRRGQPGTWDGLKEIERKKRGETGRVGGERGRQRKRGNEKAKRTRRNREPARCATTRWRVDGEALAAARPSCSMCYLPIKAGTLLFHTQTANT